MEKRKKLRFIGMGLCVPLLIMSIYLAFHISVLLVAVLTAVFTVMFVYGLKLAKGRTVEEVKKDLIDDINDLRDRE